METANPDLATRTAAAPAIAEATAPTAVPATDQAAVSISPAAAAAGRGEMGGVATAEEVARVMEEDDALFEKQLRGRGMIPDDYPPEWLPNSGKPWFGPEYQTPAAAAPSQPAGKQTHAKECGDVGQTGEHGDLGSNEA